MKLAAVAGVLAGLSPVIGTGTDGSVWEWQWHGELHPLWWILGGWALSIVLVILAVWALVSLAPVILAIIGAALGIRWLAKAGSRSRPDAAIQILRERYARGEIGKEEFDAKRRDLGEG